MLVQTGARRDPIFAGPGDADLLGMEFVHDIRRMGRRNDLEVRVLVQDRTDHREEFSLGLGMQAEVQIIDQHQTGSDGSEQGRQQAEDPHRPFTGQIPGHFGSPSEVDQDFITNVILLQTPRETLPIDRNGLRFDPADGYAIESDPLHGWDDRPKMPAWSDSNRSG